MTIELSVKDVREALQRAAGGSEVGDGDRATLLLGRLFHGVFADLVGHDAERSGIRLLLELGPERETWRERLMQHTYQALVGPRLARQQAFLQDTTEQTLVFWAAVQHLVTWLVEVTSAATTAGRPSSWEEVTRLFVPEAALACEIREPGWADGVRLTGISDSMLHVPRTSTWCALELKLGRAAPAIDLGQAALYHLIASRSRERAPSALALLRFSPELEELVIDEGQLAPAEARLIALIGRLAGVSESRSEPRSDSPPLGGRGGSPAAPRARATPPAPVGSTPTVGTPEPVPEPRADHSELGERIVRALRDYGRRVELLGAPAVGPRFLRFTAKLGPGVLFEQVRKLSPEIQIKLGLSHEPLIGRHGGRLTIEVERSDPEAIPFERIAARLPARDPVRGSSLVPIGVDVAGELRFADLSSPSHAHILVAGTTGSGKTEWLRTAIAGLLCTNTPRTLRLVLIDPKISAFTDLRASPFLWSKRAYWVPGEGRSAIDVLEDLVVEMNRRYELMGKAGADDLARYVEATGEPMARIVCFCDEYFALISESRTERQEIERQLFLLGAKARAAGIHLVMATQQPSREVIRGALDTNMPCRVGLLLQKAIESRMLLATAGAERLTGQGDLLYKDIGEPVRLQAPYLGAAERVALFRAGS